MIFPTLYFCVLLLSMARNVDGFVGVEFSWKRATSPLSSNAIPSPSRRISSSPFYDIDVFQSSSSTSYNQDNFIKQNSSDGHRTIDDPDLPVGYNRHSASDWFYNVRSFSQSSVLREVRSPVLTVAAWSLAVSVIQRVLSCSTAPGLQSLARNMCISGAAHSFLVSALSLLLVFRTNSSYQKFNEGRKIWENILSVSRNLSRMLRLYSKDVGTDRKQRILNLVAAYPYLLRHHIRSGCLCENRDDGALSDIEEIYRLQLQEPAVVPVETRHEGDNAFRKNNRSADQRQQLTCWVDRRNFPWCLFDRRSLPKVAAVRNRPLWVCDRIGQEIVSIPYTPNFTSRERLALLGQVEKLTNAVGQCERIHKTAVPLNYARHSLRGLAMWSLTLPFAIVKDFGFLTAPVAACVAWLLFGVYQIGYSIEDPFQGSLRLSILCDAIRRDVIGSPAADTLDSRDSAYSLEDEGTWDEACDDFSPRFTLPKILGNDTILSEPSLFRANGVRNAKDLIEI